MKYQENIIPNIKNKIEDFLKKKGFVNHEPLDKAFSDTTRRTYYSVVQDANGQKFFLKVRALELDFDKKGFAKQRAIGEILKKDPHLALNNFTPRLVESDSDQMDYLLYEYAEGYNLGSRTGYAVSNFNLKDIEKIVEIVKALTDFPKELLPQDFEKRGVEYYKNFLVYGHPDMENVVNLNIEWKLFNQEMRYFSHGDFKPNNFLRTKKGLMLIDFEQASICNMYADIIRLWAAEIRNIEWKNKLIEYFVQAFKINKSDKLFRDMMLIHAVFERNYLKYKFAGEIDEFLERREEEVNKVLG